MNGTEIIKKLNEARNLRHENLDTYEADEICSELSSFSEELGLGKSKCVDHKGGSGRGEHWSEVTHFIEHDVYIRISGFYSSYEGVNFEDENFEEVLPRTKEIIVYDKKQ